MFSHPDISRVLMNAGAKVLAALVKIADTIAENGKIFGVSHGGTMEATALTIFGNGPDLNMIGGRFRVCEGFRAYLVDRAVARLDTVRPPQINQPS